MSILGNGHFVVSKMERATWPVLKLDTATGDIVRIARRHRQLIIRHATWGLKLLVTCHRSITCDRPVFV